MKQTKKSKAYIIALLVMATFSGAILAKVTPLEEGHGFSSVFSEEKIAEVKTSETSEVKKEPEKVKELTYTEKINQNISESKFADRMPINLLLQTDDKWKTTPYGMENPDGNTLEINGCAILSLAMVSSYLDNKTYIPQDILNWSKNDYFVDGEGTAWSIFSDFAMMKGYQFEDLGTDIATVEEQLKQKHPVIISVKPGLFTETGHIMVLSGTNDGKFWVNDPNDSEAKGHSKKEFTADELMNEALNFWTIYK
ncbi:C39 family peptidase [Enterococcus sp. AZ126]|uniref:C39 family peptidase n=1 Tax=Enterococcus sp. AZ126 TaxID=2774635 RepID=UPI003F1FBC1F